MAKLGTFTVNDGNVTLTRGRGANKTVVLNVSFKELEIWAARNGVDEKKLWTKSYGRACKGLRAKMQKVVSRAGGVEGVPKFHDFEAFTNELRAKRGTSSRPMGGILANKDVIVAYKIGKTQYIGWPDRLAEWAVKFQDAEGDPYFTSLHRKISFWRLGLHNLPNEYIHNPRRVIPEPFGAYVDKYLDEWAEGSFYKDLAQQMARRVVV